MKTRVQCIHFTGIGGIGMSGIAELLHNQGFKVQGSDIEENANVTRLRKLGIRIEIGHRSENIEGANVVVVTSAVDRSNPEIQQALHHHIPVIPRAEMLAELMRMKQGIAVAGSHGKTTITSMIAHAMEVAGLDPTYVIGGRLMASGSNTRLGGSPWLVAEADESDGSFLRLSPTITVVSNIDPEHLDHYGDFDHLMDAFAQFVDLTPFYGRVVLHHEHPNVAALRLRLNKPVTTYGVSPQADLCLLESEPNGYQQRIKVFHRVSESTIELNLPMPGQHNAENAMAAIAVLLDIGIDHPTICQGLESFSGIQRRFHCVEHGNGVMVDDYAHHPKEIIATLKAAQTCWPDKKISAIFQPHRYSRTHDLMDEFLGCFDLSSRLTLLPIYAASEQPIEGVDSEMLAQLILQRGHHDVHVCDQLEDVEAMVMEEMKQGHVVVLLGAGSIGRAAMQIRQHIQRLEA